MSSDLIGLTKPHFGLVRLRNDFDTVWTLLNKSGPIELKTEKKKTSFVAKASFVTKKGTNEQKRAMVLLRRFPGNVRLEEAAVCFECCWESYYSCRGQKIGLYAKVLDKWTSQTRVG